MLRCNLQGTFTYVRNITSYLSCKCVCDFVVGVGVWLVDIRQHVAVGSFCFSESETPLNKYSSRVDILLIIYELITFYSDRCKIYIVPIYIYLTSFDVISNICIT
uniref:Uncharacterized protein n=1 Tax=Schizaphis graminum TaxID=13262 RepID=A0A2S2N8D8_SCHGA